MDRNAPITVRLRNVPFGQALQIILFTAAADKPPEFTAEEGRILIRAAGDASPAVAPKSDKAPEPPARGPGR